MPRDSFEVIHSLITPIPANSYDYQLWERHAHNQGFSRFGFYSQRRALSDTGGANYLYKMSFFIGYKQESNTCTIIAGNKETAWELDFLKNYESESLEAEGADEASCAFQEALSFQPYPRAFFDDDNDDNESWGYVFSLDQVYAQCSSEQNWQYDALSVFLYNIGKSLSQLDTGLDETAWEAPIRRDLFMLRETNEKGIHDSVKEQYLARCSGQVSTAQDLAFADYWNTWCDDNGPYTSLLTLAQDKGDIETVLKCLAKVPPETVFEYALGFWGSDSDATPFELNAHERHLKTLHMLDLCNKSGAQPEGWSNFRNRVISAFFGQPGLDSNTTWPASFTAEQIEFLCNQSSISRPRENASKNGLFEESAPSAQACKKRRL